MPGMFGLEERLCALETKAAVSTRETIRLECARILATRQLSSEYLVQEARELADFVMGEQDAKIIAAAKSLATAISRD